MKKISVLFLALCLLLGLAACGGSPASTPTQAPAPAANTEAPAPAPADEGGNDAPAAGNSVSLTLWVGDNYPAITQKMVDSFKAEYEADLGVTFDIQIGIESESTCKDTVLSDPEAAADVYTFADDQLFELVGAGALEAIGDYEDEVRAADLDGAVSLAEVDGSLYAFPMNVSNGYFLYYNKEFLSEEDVESLDRILEVAAENGKFFAFDMANAWYLYSFFQGAGLELVSKDGVSNESCAWNATDTTPTGARGGL